MLNRSALTPPDVLDEAVKYVSVHLQVCDWLNLSALFLNREVVCSRSAARAAGFAESTSVLLADPSIRAEMQPVWAAILDLRAAALPAARGAEAVSVGPQVSAVLDLSFAGLLPPG